MGTFGGNLFLLTFWHFCSDWLPQSHQTAVNKSSDWKLRLIHSLVYSILMMLWIILLWDVSDVFIFIFILTWLLSTHFMIDTYLPTYWWMRYIRRPPIVVEKGKEGFTEYAKTPLGIMLIVVVDQIWHIMSLILVALIL